MFAAAAGRGDLLGTLLDHGADPELRAYVLDLTTQSLTRLTSQDAIDTEPEWSRDGKEIFFTSDRAGSPQIYRMSATEGAKAERVTFTNSYNARPRLSPDGAELAMVTLESGGYSIGVMDLKSRSLRTLTRTRQDESPSYAPNGAAVIYATRDRGRGTLAIASSDGRFQQRLSSQTGDVREPVWSPFSSP
jgi:TolB protein